MGNDFNVLVEEYITPTNKKGKITIERLVSRFTHRKSAVVVLKGARLYNGKSSIVYIIGKDDNCDILEKVYRESSNGNIRITKKNNVKNSYFDFSVWNIMRIGRGQVTGSNMNMLNDDEEYKCYKVINKED